jgi:hypothetical protein
MDTLSMSAIPTTSTKRARSSDVPEAYVQAKKDAYYAVLANLKARLDLDTGTSGARTQRGAHTLTFGR